MKKLNSDLILKLPRTQWLLVLFIFLNVLVGILTFRDYGVSFDEPGIYSFARESVHAYGKFLQQVEYSDPRSNFDLRYYGPFFFIFIDLVSQSLNLFGSHFLLSDVWHLAYFFTFQIGLAFFYLLSRRWLTDWAALGTVVLFGSQPLLWGHAFINPKDIPFMVFFLASVYAGFQMVDHLAGMVEHFRSPPPGFFDWFRSSWRAWSAIPVQRKSKAKRQVRNILGFVLVIIAATPVWQNLLSGLVRQVLDGNFPFFTRFIAESSTLAPVENYIHKALIWFYWSELVVIFLLIILVFCLILRQIPEALQSLKQLFGRLFSPYVVCSGILLGLTTSVRLLGLLAGMLTALFLIYRLRRRAWLPLTIYGSLAVLGMYATWPFLWGHPVRRFMESLKMMSSFPITADILFGGQYFSVDHLPRSYLPVLLSIQLTEPAVLLFLAGTVIVLLRYKRLIKIDLLLVLVVWLLSPFLLIIVGQRTIYDNFRHLLFLIPPLFLLAGFAIEALFQAVHAFLLRLLLIMILGLSGWVAMLQLHPYEYIYYNWFAGGLQASSEKFALDYWVISFRADARYLNQAAPAHARIMVCGPANVLRLDLRPDISIVEDCSGLQDSSTRADYAVLRNQYGALALYPDAPIVFRAERQAVIFSVVKSINPIRPVRQP